MAKIFLSDTKEFLAEFKNLIFSLGEFIPVVEFDPSSFNRSPQMRIIKEENAIELSENIEEEKRSISRYSFSILPGEFIIPFTVKQGFQTRDNDGYIEARIEPAIKGVEIIPNSKITVNYGDSFNITLNITGHESRTFNLNLYANDNKDLFPGKLKDVHCGQISITVLGSSEVGFSLITYIDHLPKAPPGYWAPLHNTTDIEEIKLSQKQALMYKNCKGVCYIVTSARAQEAYIIVLGYGIVDLNIRNSNVDHRIASSQGGNDPYMGYGSGGAFARYGYGQTVDDTGVWNGVLKRGALLQLWNSIDTNNLYIDGGHSVIFRNYTYDENGNIEAIEYTDYHGEIDEWTRQYCNGRTVLGVNLLDTKL